ncbi:hypothetical protein BDQ94DRAFT_145616 [Aspergillus welwitschiae]|uniref:Secreted protein n=1 Tax=Aspergillus welwitschiae TaxID=1341132 RepID=A0A3F3PZN7_9EURO|nr:hypothetical protein BDQ94DRAFT_145616 [Aspergillus welwitschiae]RDH32202.1 hypothetical protein BDQ94DRAFT_145616 [Aspergillus welwitschiae]
MFILSYFYTLCFHVATARLASVDFDSRRCRSSYHYIAIQRCSTFFLSDLLPLIIHPDTIRECTGTHVDYYHLLPNRLLLLFPFYALLLTKR